jgi:chromate reductase
MILVISGTNRPNSKTKIVANYVYDYLKTKGEDVNLLSFDEMEWGSIAENIYDADNHPETLREIDEKLVIPSDQWIVITPEYNGSMPGVFKLFIDAISMHRYAETFAGKKALLIGVAAGRAGNLRGMEHITGFLNYLKIHVFPQKLPISSIGSVINTEGILNEATQSAVNSHIDGFLEM